MGKTSLDLVIEAAGVPESDPKKDAFHMALFMFIALSSEAENWSYGILGNVVHDFKLKLNQYMVSAKSLRTYCNKHIDYDLLAEDSEIFSKVLLYIRNAPSYKDKQQILFLLQDFVEGRVGVIDLPDPTSAPASTSPEQPQ